MDENNEQLMEKYLDGKELSIEEIKTGLRRMTIDNKLFPVVCGSALKNKGVQNMLDAVVDYLPSPLDKPILKGLNTLTNVEETVKPNAKEPFSGFAFKLMLDPFVGRLVFVRVYSGTLEKGSYVYNVNKGQKERVARLLRMHANKREEIDTLVSRLAEARKMFKL